MESSNKSEEETAKTQITIRRLQEKDGPIVAKIWVNGLSQTIENWSAPWRPLLRWAFNKEVVSTTSDDGDIGPKGANLMVKWMMADDRTFLVMAEIDDGTVGGCVGVRRDKGQSHDTNDKQSKIASIWRLSVAETARRRGVATQLMAAAEEWAKSIGCESMWLMCGNPRGQDFYRSVGYEATNWFGTEFEKSLQS
jgi:ribosomal protein S18 acetylase RimI-like enzyme